MKCYESKAVAGLTPLRLCLLGILVSAGAQAAENYTPGSVYRTLKSPHIQLRYPQEREAEARLFLTQAEALVTSYEALFRYHYTRPVVIYLSERRFDNAFVQPGHTGSEVFAVLPLNFDDQGFGFEGLDGKPYGVFAHEGIHHIQNEMGRAWIEHVFGPTISFDSYMIPSWFWEGLAVDFESMNVAHRGRMKASYHGAILRSVVQKRGHLESFDLYDDNYRWRLLGSAEYVVGSGFMRYLHDTYGDGPYLDFVRSSTHITGKSDFQEAFGLGFPELFRGFEKSLLASPPPAAPAAWWEGRADRLDNVVRFADGRVAFTASFADAESQLIVLDAQGHELSRRRWRRPYSSFWSPDFDVPDEAEALADGRFAFMSTRKTQDDIAVEGALGTRNLETGETELVLRLPDVTSAAWAPDGSRVWVTRRVKRDGNAFLELWIYDTATKTGQRLLVFENLTGVLGLRVAPDLSRLVFSGFRDPSWDIYSLDLRAADAKPALVFRSTGQDLRPRLVGSDIYFVSEVEDVFGVYALRKRATGEQELCRVDDARYLVKAFVPNGEGGVVHTDMDGRHFGVWKSGLPRRCRPVTVAERTEAPAPTLAVSPQVAELSSYEESAWKTFLPDTHYILPRYLQGDFGAKATVAGRSPYRKLAWDLSGNFWNRIGNGNASLDVTVFEPFPWVLGFTAATQRAFLYRDDGKRFREPRYDVGEASFVYPLYNHSFGGSLSYRGPRQGPGSTAGYEAWHSFADSSSTVLSVFEHRGWSLSEYVGYFPQAFGEPKGLTIGQLKQGVYVPWTISDTDGFLLTFTELAVHRPAGGPAAVIGGFNADVEFDNRIERHRYDFLSSRTIYLRGFSDLAFLGSRAVGASADYNFSLLRWSKGAMTALDRLWLNPRYDGLNVDFFVDTAKFVSGEASPDGDLHASTGARVDVTFYLSDALPYLSIFGRASHRLTDDRESEIYAGAELGGLWW